MDGGEFITRVRVQIELFRKQLNQLPNYDHQSLVIVLHNKMLEERFFRMCNRNLKFVIGPN